MLDTAPLIAMFWRTGRVAKGFDANAAFPSLVDYSPAEEARVKDAVNALSEGAMVIRMQEDYAFLRDQARACK